jgi:hypothetical protein
MDIWHFKLIPEIDLHWEWAEEMEPWLDEPQPDRREWEIEQEFQRCQWND